MPQASKYLALVENIVVQQIWHHRVEIVRLDIIAYKMLHNHNLQMESLEIYAHLGAIVHQAQPHQINVHLELIIHHLVNLYYQIVSNAHQAPTA